MPELPEVEVVRRGLSERVVGRLISHVTLLHPRATRRHAAGAADLASRLTGATITGAHRRGKYLWLTLDDPHGRALVAHLGMSGQLLVRPAPSPDAPVPSHLRVLITFADAGPALWFVDARTFGSMMLDELVVPSSGPAGQQDPVPSLVAHLARDPLDPHFDDQEFVARLRQRRTALKRALLDQTLVSGIGNIYADEALWQARLHWTTPTDQLRPSAVHELLGAIRVVLRAALDAGGTSFDQAYVDVDGRAGWFTRQLAVYGKAGQACPRCGTLVRRERFMNRSSYSCPTCQPSPPTPRY